MKKILVLIFIVLIITIGFKNLNDRNTKKNNETVVIDNDTKALSYFEDKEKEIESEIKNGELSDKTKKTIVDLTDFVFYDKEINGIKYSDLKEETKQKINDIIGTMDEKVEEKVPNYKEQIKNTFDETYPIVIDKVKEGVTYVDDTLEEIFGTADYNNAKQKISEKANQIKEKSKELIEKGQDNLSTAKDKVKSWYEGWR